MSVNHPIIRSSKMSPKEAVGLNLAHDLPPLPGSTSSLPMLRAGVRISDNLAERIASLGIAEISVTKQEIKRDPEDFFPLKDRKKLAAQVKSSFEDIRGKYENAKLNPEAIKALIQTTEEMTQQLMEMPDAALTLKNLVDADEYTYSHSVGVTSVGIMLARHHWQRVGYYDAFTKTMVKGDFPDRMQKLGLGLLIHDVGKMLVPKKILHKKGKLDPHEWAVMKQHPQYGAELVKDFVTPYVYAIVLDHHERWDGSGYPAGKKGDEIHEFSRIAAVADVYDAITSERPYQKARSAAEAIDIIKAGAARGEFDPEVVETFLEVFPPYPVGSVVDCNGQKAVVVRVEEGNPYMPFVQVKKKFRSGPEIQMDFTVQAQAA